MRKLRARTVTIKVRYADFTTVTRSHTAAAPTCSAAEIAARALALLARTDAARRPVRLLGVGAHGLVEESELVPVPASLPF
jgi:DNA polymerase-4